jgi:hypothetical protein
VKAGCNINKEAYIILQFEEDFNRGEKSAINKSAIGHGLIGSST